MTEPYYERLSTLDASFLALEDGKTYMHVGSVSLFDASLLKRKGGELDFTALERTILRILPNNPRLRQKIWWPKGAFPVWVDDPDFRVAYHIQHAALPGPGTRAQLKDLASRIMSRSLDLAKPLWEIWLVEGIEGDRCAIITKIHHSMADGITTQNILLGYLGLAPSDDLPDSVPFAARPQPSVARLHMDELRRRVQHSRDAVSELRKGLDPRRFRESMTEFAEGAWSVAASSAAEVIPTPLNREVGPHRRFDGCATDFEMIREIRKGSGAKVNDIALAIVSAAMRRFFLGRKLRVDDMDFRVMVPVSLRTGGSDGGSAGNRVASMVVPLPLFETDPRRRLQRVMDAANRAKASRQTQMQELISQAADWSGLVVPQTVTRLAARQLTANLVVTNIPGPQIPLYLRSGQMLESYPVVPLSANQGLGVALYSYNGVLYWGMNADWDLVPDVAAFTKAVEIETKRLHAAHTPIRLRSRAKLKVLAPPAAVQARSKTKAKDAAKVEQGR